MQAFRWTTILVLLLVVASCTSDDEKQKPFPIGIWQGICKGQPISIKFREDGRAILISGGEDAIGLAGYSIDLQQQPGHLDIEFRDPPWRPIRTLMEQVDTNTIRIQHFKDGTARPDTFTFDAIVLQRTQNHVLPREAKSIDERDKKIHKILMMDMIWFGGKQHEELLAICEVLFRHQFTHNASAVQQKAAVYYLSIDYKDPPEKLLACFHGHSPPVKPGSVFRVGNGIKFEIHSIIWLDETTVEIKGGYYEGNASSSGNTYRLRREDGAWKVINDKMEWIS